MYLCAPTTKENQTTNLKRCLRPVEQAVYFHVQQTQLLSYKIFNHRSQLEHQVHKPLRTKA